MSNFCLSEQKDLTARRPLAFGADEFGMRLDPLYDLARVLCDEKCRYPFQPLQCRDRSIYYVRDVLRKVSEIEA